MTSAPTPKLSLLFGALLLIAFGVYGYFAYLDWHFDDGMIVARIVRNILSGDGWVYNSGEFINASTSVLNTILITAASYFVGDILIASHLIGALSITGASMCLWRILSPLYGDTLAITAGALLSWILIHNSTWGLEIYLFTALFLFFILREQQSKDTWLLVGFLILARPDAVVVALFKIIRTRINKEPLAFGLIKLSIPLIPWAIFSICTFGQIFPNTLSNKIWQGRSGMWGHGAIYLKALAKHIIALPWPMYFMLLLAPFGALVLYMKRSPILYLIAFITAQQAAYCVLNVPGYHWYFSLLTAAILIVGFVGAARLIEFRFPALLCSISNPLVVTIATSAAAAWLGYLLQIQNHSFTDVRDIKYTQAVKEFESAKLGEGALGTLEVGSIGYHSPRHIVDLTGLTSANPEFITGKNTDDFFEKPPRFLLLHSPPWHFERSIIDDLRFDLMYEPVPSVPNPQHGLSLFKIKDGVTNLDKRSLESAIRAQFKPAVSLNPAVLGECKTECLCIIDYLNGQFSSIKEIHTKRTIIRARGWAAELDKRDSDSSIELILRSNNLLFGITGHRESRPDVAEHLQRPDLTNTGFSIEGSILDLPTGRYEVLIGQGRGDTKRICATTLSLFIE